MAYALEQGIDFLDWVHDEDPTAWERWFRNIEGYEHWTDRDHAAFMEHEQMQHIAKCDYTEMDRCDAGVLILPSGNSSHMEIGYMIGTGKPCAILFAGNESTREISPEPMRVGADFWTSDFLTLFDWLAQLQEQEALGATV